MENPINRSGVDAGGVNLRGQADLGGVVDTLDLDADIVVNNAGLQTVAPVQELLPERVALKLRVLEVTLGASFRLRRDVRPGYVRIRWSSWTAR
jgi:3-hydroxybutyrate dehydrogenase